MFNRRTFLSLAAGSITAPRLASAQEASRKVALYANVGADLTHYDVDVASAELIKEKQSRCLRGCNMPGRMHRDAIYMSRPTVALPVTAGLGPNTTSPRSASIPQLALSARTELLNGRRRALSTSARTFRLYTFSRGVQQSERGAHRPHQTRLHARRRGDPAGSDRRRHLCPPGAHDAR